MAFTFVIPMTPEAEETLRENASAVQRLIRTAVRETWDVPNSDIITEICRCPVLVSDQTAVTLGSQPDVLILVFTSDEDKRQLTAALIQAIQNVWEFALKAEIWISFFDGWGTTFPIP